MLYAKIDWTSQMVRYKKFLKVMKVLSLCLYYLSLEKGMHFICTNLNLLPKNALILEKNFLKLSNYFHFCPWSPLEKGCGPSFIKICIYFAQRCLVQSLDVIESVVPEKKFFLKCHQHICTILLVCFPLGKDWISFALRYFVLSLDEIGSFFLEEKIFICSQHIFNISPLQVIDLTGKCCGPWAALLLITERLLIDLYCLFMAFTCYYLKIQQYIFSSILYLDPLPGSWYCDAKWKTSIFSSI